MTYKFHAVESNNGTNSYTLTFERTSGTGFGYSTGQKTATISNIQSTSGTSATTINAFRAYFQLNLDGSTDIKEFRLNFGEEDATNVENVQCSMFNQRRGIRSTAGSSTASLRSAASTSTEAKLS